MLLAALIIESLTGQSVACDEADVESVVGCLAEVGWDAERLQATRDQALASGETWPRFIPAARRGDVGLAQLNAATALVLEHLGVGPSVRVRTGGELDARDRALMAERPPHHGAVG